MTSEPPVAGKTVLELAARHGCGTQAALRQRIEESEGVPIQHQKLSQWVNGESSFPNDFADLVTRALDLPHSEQVELALALSFGQRNRLLRK